MAAAVRRLLIFGAPGSGKGTISSRITKDLQAVQISTGDLLRLHISQGTDIGKQAASITRSGGLVPDSVMILLVEDELKKIAGKSWLLDGFPRTLPQAQALDTMCKSNKQPLDMVLSLDVAHSIIIERIRGRYVHLASGRVYNLDYNPPKKPSLDDVTGEPLTKRLDDTEERWSKEMREQRQHDADQAIKASHWSIEEQLRQARSKLKVAEEELTAKSELLQSYILKETTAPVIGGTVSTPQVGRKNTMKHPVTSLPSDPVLMQEVNQRLQALLQDLATKNAILQNKIDHLESDRRHTRTTLLSSSTS